MSVEVPTYSGYELRKTDLVPEGQLLWTVRTIYAAPLTYWSLQHGGRYPFECKYSRGMIELERERRRRAKALQG